MATVKRTRFINEPNIALKCLLCFDVANDPLQHEACGNLICRKCLDRYGKDRPCPKCKEKSEYYMDNKSRRDIQALRVKCSNDKSCEWEGSFSMLAVHAATCRFNLVPCPMECKDYCNEVKHFLKKDLDKHVRDECLNRVTECKTCNKKGVYTDIQLHSIACGKTKLPCPDCDNEICEDINEHYRNECLFTAIPCKYKNIGCRRKTKRRDTIAHEQDHELHLGMALNAMVELKEAVVNLQEVNILKKEKGKILVVFSVTEFEAKRCTDQKLTSPSFYTSPSGYRMACRVYANGDGDGKGTHLSVRAALLEGKSDSELSWPFAGSITFTLLNQLEDKNHYSSTTTLNIEHNAVVGIDWGKPKFVLHSKLDYDEGKNTQYLMDDRLYFRVSVEVADHRPWLECFSEINSIARF